MVTTSPSLYVRTSVGEVNEAVAQEIIALHHEFERWFHGQSDSLSRVEQSLADDFLFVAPNGAVVDRADLIAGLRNGHGQHGFGIRVENVTLRWRRGDVVAASYEEWHTHADYTTTRQSTAVMEHASEAPGGFTWLAVHETWVTPPPRS